MDFFSSLALVLGVAAVGGIVAKLLKQPVIVGYILAGVVISFLHVNQSGEMIAVMGRLGITLLLFLVGLELPLDELSRMGKSATITGLCQLAITSAVGFGLAILLGFGVTTSLYLGVALAFGSTVIVINLLSQKKDLQSLYGRISVGYLLVQDFVAIGIMIILSGLSQGGVNPVSLGWVMVKGIILVSLAAWASNKILPKALDWFGKSTEILFIVSLAWCLGVAAAVSSPWIGFTVELGGFLAGLTLANAVQNLQIVSRIRPLRDFFLTLFFVGLGASIGGADLQSLLLPAIVLSAFVAIGNPIILMLVLGAQGYNKRVAFLAGVTVAQVSEFALIVLTMAASVGHIPTAIVSLAALVALVTMVLSSYFILHAEKIYQQIKNYLVFFENKKSRQPRKKSEAPFGEIVLFGHNRVGNIIRPILEKLNPSLLVVDFDPQILASLKNQGVRAIYGDIADYELYDDINLAKSDLIISTVSDLTDSLQLLKYTGSLKNHRPTVVVLAQDNSDARKLYRAGADYVLVPHMVGGEYLKEIIELCKLDWKQLAHKGKIHESNLTKIFSMSL